MKWRVIALDMDGTSLTEGNTISDENRKWLYKAREAGVEFTFATGRHRLGVLTDLVRDLGIQVPVVTMNGGEVWTPDGALLARHTLACDDVAWFRELAEKYGSGYWAGSVDGPVNMDEFPQDVQHQAWLKFGFFTSYRGTVEEIWHELSSVGRFELTNSHPLNIEVNPIGVTKAAGLQVLADHLGITNEHIVAIGDSLNDVPMIRWAGLGIAMGNAQEVVKAEADWVTTSCQEHGVARAIEQLLQGNIG